MIPEYEMQEQTIVYRRQTHSCVFIVALATKNKDHLASSQQLNPCLELVQAQNICKCVILITCTSPELVVVRSSPLSSNTPAIQIVIGSVYEQIIFHYIWMDLILVSLSHSRHLKPQRWLRKPLLSKKFFFLIFFFFQLVQIILHHRSVFLLVLLHMERNFHRWGWGVFH